MVAIPPQEMHSIEITAPEALLATAGDPLSPEAHGLCREVQTLVLPRADEDPPDRLIGIRVRLESLITRLELAGTPLALVPVEPNDPPGVISDKYFRVRRVANLDPVVAIVAAVLASTARVLRFSEAETSGLTSLERAHLLRPLCVIGQLPVLLGTAGDLPAASVGSETFEALPVIDSIDPLAQWVYGHHLFIGIDNLLILVLAVLGHALDQERWVDAERAFRIAGMLMLGSAAAMKATGDFPSEVYVQWIRPDMARHHPEMSGINMEDHGLLVKTIRRLRIDDRQKSLPEPVGSACRDFIVDRVAALDGHVHVCEFAVGSEIASMRSEARANGNAVPAVESTTKLAASRRRQTGCPRRRDD